MLEYFCTSHGLVFECIKGTARVIALDSNHANLCYGIDAEGQAIEIATSSWLKADDARLAELKKKRDRCCKKSQKVEVCDENKISIGKAHWAMSSISARGCLRKSTGK